MAEKPTTGELYKAKTIFEADLEAAVEAVLAGRATDQHLLAGGYTIDLVAASLTRSPRRVSPSKVPPLPTAATWRARRSCWRRR